MSMQYGFHYNGARCTGCKTCVLACKDYHDLSTDIAFRQVYEYEGGSWKQDRRGTWHTDCFAYYVSNACNHCADPACMAVCPTGAMHKDERGLVSVNVRRCIGCGYCALSCPYRAPKVDRQAGHSVKCDGCTQRVEQGLPPICVAACPLRALDFGPIEDLRAEYGGLATVAPLPPETETYPNLVITPPHNACEPGSGAGHVGNKDELV